MSKVVVGMSGGVDSSVAAWLLQQQGHEVIGVTMQFGQDETEGKPEENEGCCGPSAAEDARRVASQLGIPFYVMNFREEFKNHVMNYFAEEYINGRTPNPCIVCNRYVKWEALLKYGLSMGAEYVATGHYARIERLENGRYSLKSSVTARKDQTYALYSLTQRQLARTLMPAGSYEKEEIRQMAEKLGLLVAHKADSQEICFIPDQDYAGFIRRQAGHVPEPGNFVDTKGNVIGRHKGIIHYTIGQRKGLNLSMGRPVFVVKIRPETNEVVIGNANDVFTDILICDKLNWMAIDGLHGEERQVMAKIRYSHKGAPAIIRKIEDDQVECRFLEPVRAVTPGQAAVFYEGDYVIGGGTIR